MVSIVLFLSGSKSPVSEATASVSSELAAAKQLPPCAKSYYLWMLLLLPFIVHSHEIPKGGWGVVQQNCDPNYHMIYELMSGMVWGPACWVT